VACSAERRVDDDPPRSLLDSGSHDHHRAVYVFSTDGNIEIIPMIDTMFFLLVFFMVATLSMTVQRSFQVNLPRAATGQDDVRKVVSLTITKEGRLYVDKREAKSRSDAVSMLLGSGVSISEVTVVINADRSVEHGQVVELMDEVRQGGITRIAIAVQPRLDPGK
jgi:biopolymer transport protein ExbD